VTDLAGYLPFDLAAPPEWAGRIGLSGERRGDL